MKRRIQVDLAMSLARVEASLKSQFSFLLWDFYLPRTEQRMRPSRYRGYKVLWGEKKPFCTGLWTRDVRTRHVQAVLDEMAKTDRFNINSLKHIKSFLSGIFRLADQQGYYDRNHAREGDRLNDAAPSTAPGDTNFRSARKDKSE